MTTLIERLKNVARADEAMALCAEAAAALESYQQGGAKPAGVMTTETAAPIVDAPAPEEPPAKKSKKVSAMGWAGGKGKA